MSTMRAVVDDESLVRPYDPLRHEVIDRVQLRHLHPLLEACANRMAASLSTSLRRPVHVAAGEFEQAAWGDYRGSMEDPAFIASVLAAGLDERLLLHIPVSTALCLVEVQLGGDGRTETGREALTEIEFSMVGSIASQLLAVLCGAFDASLDLRVTTLQLHRSPHFVKMASGEATFRSEADVTAGDGGLGSVWIYMPLGIIYSLLSTLEQEEEDRLDPDGGLPDVERVIEDVPLELCVAYPQVHMSAAQVLSLRPGDPDSIILLGVGTNQAVDLDILAGRTRIGRGVLVTNGKRAGCMVKGWERKEER